MGVLIKDYCKENTNDFARRLEKLWKEAVIISSDVLEYTSYKSEVIAKVYIGHCITSLDIEVMQRVLAGYYWRFLPSFEGRGLELWIDVYKDML